MPMFVIPMDEIIVKDSNGTVLAEGDAVITTKTLDVKGANMSIKKGQKIKNIRLTDDPLHVECRVDKTRVVLKTEFLKKA